MEDETIMFIGLSGKLGSGKNYLAEKVLPILLPSLVPPERVLHIFQLAFGDQMKVELAVRNPCLTYESLFQNKSPETRQLMQVYGTNLCRKQYGEDVWIRSLDMWIEIHKARLCCNAFPVFIISDVRFKNEAKWVEEKGGILLRVEAPDRTRMRIQSEELSLETANHLSETDLDLYPFENLIDNSIGVSEETLRNQLLEALTK